MTHTRRHFLVVTAILEVGRGGVLLAVPSRVTDLVLGAPLVAPDAFVVARLAGVAILCLGIACWRARFDDLTHAASAIISAMALYHVGAAGVLVLAAMLQTLGGPILWPVVVGHAVLAAWALECLRRA